MRTEEKEAGALQSMMCNNSRHASFLLLGNNIDSVVYMHNLNRDARQMIAVDC